MEKELTNNNDGRKARISRLVDMKFPSMIHRTVTASHASQLRLFTLGFKGT